MVEIDLLEATRRDDNYAEINKILDSLNNLSVFPTLVWVYVWDIVKDKLNDYSDDAYEDYQVNPELSEKDIWDMFWDDADKNGWSLEYGTESLHDAVFDWMLERDIITVQYTTEAE